MPAAELQILSQAIARNYAVVVSLPSAGLLRHHKSRFFGQDSHGIWVQADFGERALVDQLTASGAPIAISFKQGQQKTMFAAPIIRYDEAFQINEDTTVPAILLEHPKAIRSEQRRNHYRVRVLPDSMIGLRAWRIAPRIPVDDRPQASQELTVELRDLSLGGLGVIFRGKNGEKPKVTSEDRLRVEIQYEGKSLIMEAKMRSPSGPQPPDAVCTGLQLKDLGSNWAGRKKLSELTRVLSDLQREEVRRLRLA